MPGIANVSLTDTFDTWRITTNQLIIAYDQSYGFVTNTANDLANSVNVSIASVIDSGNNANVFAMRYANTIGNTSNLYAMTYANTISDVVKPYANTIANNANSYANATFTTLANGAVIFGQANLAFTQANIVFGQANIAYTQANDAYTRANTRVATVAGTGGRITSSGTTAITLDLATSGAGAASYTGGISAVTVDAYGRVSSVTGSANYQPALGFTPVRQGGGTGQLNNTLYMGWSSGAQLLLQVDATNFGASWPINITGSASSAASATFATTASSATTATTATNALSLGGFTAASYPRLTGATFTGALSATSLTTVGAISAASLDGGISTGTGATGTWPISITGNAGNGRTLLNTINLSSSATAFDITSFSSSYTFFEIDLVNVVPVTNGTILYMRVYSGGSYQATTYAGSGVIPSNYWLTYGRELFSTATQGQLTWGASAVSSNTSYGGVTGTISVANPVTNTSSFKMFRADLQHSFPGGWGNAPMPNFSAFQWQGSAAAITGFQIYFSAGNIASGQVRVYGRN